MQRKTLNVPVEHYGRLIGKQGRNIRLVNKIISPGRVVITDKVEVIGNMEDKAWCNKAIRVIRSAHRGGIIKWFDTWEREHFNTTEDQNWLDSIRKIQKTTGCNVTQMAIDYNAEMHEVWVVLEDGTKSDLDTAIESIGKCVHRRYRRLRKTESYKTRYKHILSRYLK